MVQKKRKISIDFQIHKPVLTHRMRRRLKTPKVQPTEEQAQRKVNSQAATVERRSAMSLEERRERRKKLRAQTGIFSKEIKQCSTLPHRIIGTN